MSDIQAGDVCVVVRSGLKDYPPGTEVTVLAVLAPWERQYPQAPYVIENSRHRMVVGGDRELRKKRPPPAYDGDGAGDWELCPWRPGRVVTEANPLRRSKICP